MKPQTSLVQLRGLAVKALAQVYHSNQTLDESLIDEFTKRSGNTLPEFDRAWVYDLCAGILRYRGRIDFIIDTYSLKKKPSGALRRFLQTAVFQLLAQDVAPALAVSETVQAIRESEGEAPAKFANAILRKVADSREQWRTWKVSESSEFNEQVAWSSLPEWLFKKFRKQRGTPWTFSYAATSLERPKIWYRDLTKDAPIELTEGYRGNEPLGYVQDISNQELVMKVVDSLGKMKSGAKILDLCSAPGGKSMGLASHGFSVTATDLDSQRLQKVVENTTRLKFGEKITIRPYDQLLASSEEFDVIWIDAPCSSTGIIRRHPEIKWNRNWHDVEQLIVKQQFLIDWARDHLSKNGKIIYSTCSVLQEENPKESAGLTAREHWEWFPNDGQGSGGDAIIATVFEKP